MEMFKEMPEDIKYIIKSIYFKDFIRRSFGSVIEDINKTEGYAYIAKARKILYLLDQIQKSKINVTVILHDYSDISSEIALQMCIMYKYHTCDWVSTTDSLLEIVKGDSIIFKEGHWFKLEGMNQDSDQELVLTIIEDKVIVEDVSEGLLKFHGSNDNMGCLKVEDEVKKLPVEVICKRRRLRL